MPSLQLFNAPAALGLLLPNTLSHSPLSHRVLYWMPSALKYSGYRAPTQLTTWLMPCLASTALSAATASPDTYNPSATCCRIINRRHDHCQVQCKRATAASTATRRGHTIQNCTQPMQQLCTSISSACFTALSNEPLPATCLGTVLLKESEFLPLQDRLARGRITTRQGGQTLQ